MFRFTRQRDCVTTHGLWNTLLFRSIYLHYSRRKDLHVSIRICFFWCWRPAISSRRIMCLCNLGHISLNDDRYTSEYKLRLWRRLENDDRVYVNRIWRIIGFCQSLAELGKIPIIMINVESGYQLWLLINE